MAGGVISAISIYTVIGKPALNVKILEENSKTLTRGSEHGEGYDIYSCETISIPPKERRLVSTHIAIAIQTGTYARIASRSGLSIKNSVDIGGGVIDADYRGHIKVVLINSSQKELQVTTGD